MTALRDARPIRSDAAALRGRLREDGYLFMPGLLDPVLVAAVRKDVAAVLAQHAWLAEGPDPLEGVPGPEPILPNEERWWPGYAGVLALESFNRLAHEPAITELMAAILGEDLLVQPMKIFRATWPRTEFPTNPHQDFFFVRGSSDVLTAWIPLGDCPPALGGLRVLPGSHREGLRSVRLARGAGNITAEVDEDDPRWTDPHHYRPGDVLLFHSLTVHQAPANEGDVLRLSADFRYQSSSDPIVAAVLFPHESLSGRTPSWPALTQDWETTRWIEPQHPVRVAPWRVDPQAVPASRFADEG